MFKAIIAIVNLLARTATGANYFDQANAIGRLAAARDLINAYFQPGYEAKAEPLEVERAVRHALAQPDPSNLSDQDGLRQLRLLYNHSDSDEPQFTRWQMIGAMHHGMCLAQRPGGRETITEVALAGCDNMPGQAEALLKGRIGRLSYWVRMLRQMALEGVKPDAHALGQTEAALNDMPDPRPSQRIRYRDAP